MIGRYRDNLEAFNRASHSDALREMQLVERYVDPIRPTPRRVIRSMGTRDLLVSAAFAVLVVIVVPGVLLVLTAL